MFTKIGPTLLLIGYFIPGVRHLTAYIAAINNYPYRKFALLPIQVHLFGRSHLYH